MKPNGEAIKKLRQEIGLTQVEFAIDAGISRSLLASLETERRGTTSPVMRKVARAGGLRSYDTLIHTEEG